MEDDKALYPVSRQYNLEGIKPVYMGRKIADVVPRGHKGAGRGKRPTKSLIDDSGNGAQVCLIRPLTEVDVIETITRHIWRSRCIDIGEVWGNDFVPTGEGKRREVAKGCPEGNITVIVDEQDRLGNTKEMEGHA
jgi:hypothetical protein